MNALRRFLRLIGALVLVVATGVIGYMVIQGWSFLDALYMTVITISTVGYKEVGDLSTAGRIFSIVLIIGGVGIMFYAFTSVVQYIIEGNLEDVFRRGRMKDRISRLKDHIILCGYGRVGAEVGRVFAQEAVPFLVVDPDEKSIASAAEDGCLYLQGNAASDETLKEAGIGRARALVAAAGSDAINVFIVLSARGLRPDLFISARAGDQEAESKLKRAGADRTIYPHVLGGRRLAMLALRPLVTDFVDTALHSREAELILEGIKVGQGSPLASRSFREGRNSCGGAVILAVKKKDGNVLTNLTDETPDSTFELGDELVVLGTRDQLRALEGST